MTSNYPQLVCGFDGLLNPMAPDNANAFNPCFITMTLSIFSAYFILYGSFVWKSFSGKPRYGKRGLKSIGFNHYIRVNSVLLEILLVFYLTSFISIHERLADQKIIAFGLLQSLLVLIILPIHYMEVFYVYKQSAILLLFWPLLIIILIALFYQDNFTDFVIINSMQSKLIELLLILNSFSVFCQELYHWKPCHELVKHLINSNQKEKLKEPNLIQGITFTWMNAMIMESYHSKSVTTTKIPEIASDISAQYSYTAIRKFWKGDHLMISLVRAFWSVILASFIFELAATLLNYIQPQLLRVLILFFKVESPPLLKGILISIAMFTNTLLQTSLNNKYMISNLKVGLNVRAAIYTLLYQKTLKLSGEAKLKASSGDIISLLSVDANRIQKAFTDLSTIIIAPIELVICIFSLWSLLGPATLSGLAVMLILIPINTIVVRIVRKLNKKQMSLIDSRSRIVNEIFSSIKSIKLYAWEKPMLTKLHIARNDLELNNLFKIRMVQQITSFIWTVMPFLVSFVCFATFVTIQKIPLTSDIVFPALTLLNLLSNPLSDFPSVLQTCIEAQVSIKRIQTFLCDEEIDNSHITESNNLSDEKRVVISNCSFFWTKSAESSRQAALVNVNFRVNKNCLSCIVGKVGSGKTSLLYALLGQLVTERGNLLSNPKIEINGSTVYCSQSPWIMNGSVKENILFGCKFDKEFYESTIEACQLIPDLAILPDGDETQVGEKGISLSGGQKARLSLARAVYARGDIYLLDDILAAVDAHVGKNIIEKVLSKRGVLASKTIILCTNSIKVLKYSDNITMIDKGKIIETTTYDKIDNKDHPMLYNLISTFDRETSEESRKTKKEEIVQTDSTSEPVASQRSLRRASMETFKWDPLQNLLPTLRSGQTQEVSQKGKVKWSVYHNYIKACSIPGFFLWMLLVITSTGLSVGGNYWLKYWTEENSKQSDNSNVKMFLLVYCAFGLGASAVSVIRNSVMKLWLGINASKHFHDDMAKRVISAPMSFFESTPTGRIMNRFTSDINKIDDGIPSVFQRFAGQVVRTIFRLGVVTFAIPLYFFVISILSILYVYYEIYYLAISRELKRLVSVSRSPIYSHLGESITGMDTVRAYNQMDRFIFIMNSNIDFNLKSLYTLTSINRWLYFRLQVIGGLGIFSASMLTIMSIRTSHPLTSSMAGFVMTYALQVTSSLRALVRSSAELETSVVAVERCMDYTELPIEGDAKIKNLIKPPLSWPQNGSIQFKNYSTRYRSNQDLILKDVELSVKSGEKIGVVGRTGAGKSSLTLAIFRIIEPARGSIIIDDINVSNIDLFDLRKNLCIIPQDSQLFEGTIRQNLDPFNFYTDDEICNSIRLAHLEEHILNLRGPKDNSNVLADKLELNVFEGGSNFSAGQKQLLSLARVLLKVNDSQMLILDEATAAVDVQTDELIQRTIRKEFHTKTIITIAHRLETIMDSDKVICLDKGRVVDFDSPEKLLKNQKGVFFELYNQNRLT